MGICKSVSFTKKVNATTVSVIDERIIVQNKPVNNMGRNTGLRSVLKCANTGVGALSARSAVGLKSANTVVSALGARLAVVVESANTTVRGTSVRSVTPLDT